MLLNASALNAVPLGAAAQTGGQEAGVFRPRAITAAQIVIGQPQWLVHTAFDVPSVAGTHIGRPELDISSIRRLNAPGMGVLATVGLPSLRLVYPGGVPTGPKLFTPYGVSETRLGVPQLSLHIALDATGLYGTRIGRPGMVQVLVTPGVDAPPRIGQPALVHRFNPRPLQAGALGIPAWVQVFCPAVPGPARIGRPLLGLRSSAEVSGSDAAIQVGTPQLRFVHRAYPTSRLAQVGYPSLRRGHAC